MWSKNIVLYQAHQFADQFVLKEVIFRIEYGMTRIILIDFGNIYEIKLKIGDIKDILKDNISTKMNGANFANISSTPI